MKVKELIAILSKHNPDDDVHFAYPKGDYWHTTVAPEVTRVGYDDIHLAASNRDLDMLVESEHREGDPPRRRVVIIR
jgi:hypothetical protein